ncbi:MAG: PAS domain-containing protein, partial [Sneathiella sp.]|nr:PAS domain-containing protein [Sneathiella sp.]
MSKVELQNVTEFSERQEGLKLALSVTPDPAIIVSNGGTILHKNDFWLELEQKRGVTDLSTVLAKDIAHQVLDIRNAPAAPHSFTDIGFHLNETQMMADLRITALEELLLINFRVKEKDSLFLPSHLSDWEAALEAIPAPVFFKDDKMIYRAANNAFLKYLGRPREDIIGKSVFEISPGEQAAIYHKADTDLFEQGGHQTYETSVIDKQGREKFVIFHKSQIKSADGTPVGLIGIILDITDRKIAEREAREKAAILEAIVQNSYAHIFIKDVEGRYVHAGDSFNRLFGWKPEHMLGKKDHDLFEPQVADEFIAADKHVIETGEVINLRDQLDT